MEIPVKRNRLFILLFFVLSFVAPQARSAHVRFSLMQAAAPSASSVAGHYEGIAKNKAQDSIPLTIDIEISDGKPSGAIMTPLGTYSITGGTTDGSGVKILFDAGGQTGSITAKLAGDKLSGSFELGDDGGPIDAKRTDASPHTPAEAQRTLAKPILFLGVYHMNNPGLDAVNLQADDVLSAKRQQEIETLVENLAAFHPSKIAIEADPKDGEWANRYKEYLAGRYTLTRDEREQVGFRLAKRVGLPTIYGVDYLMYMNGLTPSEMADQPSKSETEKPASNQLSAEDVLLRQSTVTQYLFHLNSEEQIQKNAEGYMDMLLPDNDPAIYRNADLVANWYKRNLRIFENINRVTEQAGTDRILVIIGAGHLRLLKQFASDAPYYRLEDTETYLKH
jgi:Family of unknown function (DUF5694)